MDLNNLYKNTPIYFGHRGELNHAPENTIDSYLLAIRNGLKAIELDVMLTKDGELICSHNYDLERETNGNGFVDEREFQYLTQIKAGKQFPIKKQSKIPSLYDVVAVLPKAILINIEIKTKNALDLKGAIKVARLIKNGDVLHNVLVSSFNPLAVRVVKIISKEIPTGYIYEQAKHFKGVFIARPDCLHPDAELITNKVIKFCRKRNMRINTWTVNNEVAVDWLKNKQIDGIITDNPKLAR